MKLYVAYTAQNQVNSLVTGYAIINDESMPKSKEDIDRIIGIIAKAESLSHVVPINWFELK